MNKIFLALIVCLTSVMVTHAAPKTPKYNNKQIALFSYTLSLDQPVREVLNKHLSLFEANPKVDPIERKLRNRIYYLLKERLEKEIGLGFLPIESFQNAISYDNFGFPSDNISRVIRVGTSRLYYKIEITISSGDQSSSGTSSRKNKTNKNEEMEALNIFRPSISILMTIFNNKGIIPIDKFQGIGSAIEALPTDATLLNGLVNEEPYEERNNLMGVANEAVTDLIVNMQLK